MKLYVAGPMRGLPDFNFPAFYAAEARLVELGHEVRNPARHDNDSGFDETLNTLDGFDMRAAFGWDVDAIFWADGIYLLRGWANSQGATLERRICEFVGGQVFYEGHGPVPA